MLSVHSWATELTDDEGGPRVDIAELKSSIATSIGEGNPTHFFCAAWKIYVSEMEEKIESSRAFLALDQSGVVFDDARIQLLRSVLCANIAVKMAHGDASDAEVDLFYEIGVKHARATASGQLVSMFTHINDPRVQMAMTTSRSVKSLENNAVAVIEQLRSALPTCLTLMRSVVSEALRRLTEEQ